MPRSSTSGQGRPKGVPNKATAEIKDLARAYGPEVLERLYALAKGAESEQARVAACKEILDRGYGKPSQSVALGQDPDLEPIGLEVGLRPSISRDEWLKQHKG
jgi:hypothetical protein